jgi:plastocyanin
MSRSIIGGLLQGITRGSKSAGRARHIRRAMHSPWLESLEERALLAVTNVHLVNFSFAPSTVTIHVGDTVHWIWDTDNHSTTSVSTSAVQWDSQVHNTGFTFDVMFNQAGSFNYFCKIHGQDLGGGQTSGMAGTITVLPPPTVTSIVVSPANPNVTVGGSENFTAMGTFSDGSSHDVTNDVTWNSSNTAVATISNTAGSKGQANAVASGTSTIMATEGTVSGSTVMHVIAPLASIAVTPTNPSVPKGETVQFTATGTLTDNSTIDLTNSVTWSSSSLATASISNAAGLNGAATGLALGTTTITATMGTISGSTTLTVTNPVLQSITISPATAGLAIGATQQFTATGVLSDHSTEDLTNLATWTSSAQSIATVSASGLATAQSAGSATIDANFQGITGSATLTVAAPPPPLVTVVSITPVLNKKHKVTSLDVVLSGPVNPTEAQAKIIYRLLASSKKNAFVAKRAKPIAVKLARYTPATNTIVITPKKPFALSNPVQLVISAGPPLGLQDSLGRFIDGDRNGTAGGNEVAVISKNSVVI